MPSSTSRRGAGRAAVGVISGLPKEAERLRAGLDARIARERESAHGDPGAETKLWLDKLADVDRERARYQEMAAEDLIHFEVEELRARIAELEDTRSTAERGLSLPRNRHEQIRQFDKDRETLLEVYVGLVPEALDGLAAPERHRVSKMLGVAAAIGADGSLQLSGDVMSVYEMEIVSASKFGFARVSLRAVWYYRHAATSCNCCATPSSIAWSENRSSAVAYPALAKALALSGSINKPRSTSARAFGSPGGTRTPLSPSSMISNTPPPRVATTGRFASMPSTTTRPKGSGATEVCTTTSERRINCGMSRRNPTKCTRSSKPKSLLCWRRASA